MNTAHGAGSGKWVFDIANSAIPLFSKIWVWWSDILNTYIHSNRCIYMCWYYHCYFIDLYIDTF